MLHSICEGWIPSASNAVFCMPGILTTAQALLTGEPDTDADRIYFSLFGNLCRCTGHVLNVAAVLEARSACRKADKS